MSNYIHKGKVVENNLPTDEIVRSYLLEEQEYAHVIMTEQMIEFYEQNPNSSIEEIFNLENNFS